MVAPHTAKRKHTTGDQGEQSEASSSRSGLGGIGVGVGAGRVTRRSAAAAALGPSSGGVSAPGIPSSTKVSTLNSRNDGKPEADLKSWNGQIEAGSSGVQGSPESRKPDKRARNSSTNQTPLSPNTVVKGSSPPIKPSVPSPTKEFISQLPYLSLRPHLPYPIGLTPFRYPCLHPSHPAPPPGDPLNPKWKPYNPDHISHLDPLPDSVRALSALGREPRIYLPAVMDEMGRRSMGTAKGIAMPSYGQTSDSRTSLNSHALQTQSSSHPRDDILDTQLDPQLASLPPPNPSIPPPTPTTIHPPPQPDVQPPSPPLPHAHALDPPIPGDGDPTFDINTFFESASFETISALLATGDNVGVGEGSGPGAGTESGIGTETRTS